MSKVQRFGWGLYPKIETNVKQPRSIAELADMVRSTDSFIPAGQGRAYGDSALNEKCILSTTSLNRMIMFDDVTGVLRCEAGVTIDEVLGVFVPRGWFIAVTPGTRFVSLGGAVASDVHGKNHHKVGSFSSCVIEFELLLATGELIRCSRKENAELFTATFGAMGLTGIVTTVVMRLEKVETAYIRQKTIKAENLAEVMQAFEATSDWTYSVAWIDCVAKGDEVGRSVLTIGEHAGINEVPQSVNAKPLSLKKKIKLNVPFHFPSFLLNSFTVKLFNKLYYWKSNQGDALVPYDSFFYPLDSILNWNRIYGKRGFTQYQCVIPMQNSEAALKELLQKIADSGLASFLAVLKLFGKQEGLLSFPTEGYTLALDFPMSSASLLLLDELDKIVKKYEGRLYLTKDVRMSADFFRSSYDADSIARFNTLRLNFDPEKKINSLQSQRLGI